MPFCWRCISIPGSLEAVGWWLVIVLSCTFCFDTYTDVKAGPLQNTLRIT
jgi:hypothetical protein